MLIAIEYALGDDGLVIPLITMVKLLFEGMEEAVVTSATRMVLEALRKLQELDEIVKLRIDTEQVGEAITKSVGKVNVIAGELPSFCPIRKLKVYPALATIALLERAKLPLELLKVVAEAVIVVFKWRYVSELRLKMKARVTGVSEGGNKKAEH